MRWTQFQAATKDDPQFALAFSKLAQAYSQLGQDDDAGEASLQSRESKRESSRL